MSSSICEVHKQPETVALGAYRKVTIENSAGGTLYYGSTSNVSSTTNDGNLTAGNSVTVTQTTYIVSASATSVVLIWDFGSPVLGSGLDLSSFCQQATTGTVTGFTAPTTTNAVYADSTFTGDAGDTAYTIGDVVLALKNVGLLAP